MTIRGRIYAGFAVVALLVAAQLHVTLTGLSRLREVRQELAGEIEPRVAAAEGCERAVLYRAIAFRNLLMVDGPLQRAAYARRVAESDAAFGALANVSPTGQNRVLAARVLELRTSFDGLRDEAFEAIAQGASKEHVAELEGRIAIGREALLDAVRAYATVQQGRQAELRARAEVSQADVRNALLGTAGLVLATALAMALLTHRAVRRPAADLVAAARALEGGDYGPALEAGRRSANARDELDELAAAVGRMAGALRRREERLVAEGRVGAALASTLDVEELASKAVDEVARFAGVELVAAYLPDDAGALRRAAGHCADAASAEVAREGIVGQALATGRTVVASALPPDAPFRIQLGVDALPPRTIAAVPFALDGAEVGVVLIASVRDLSADAVPFLERVAAQLAISARHARAHGRAQDLAVELEATNARLVDQNGQLQAQTEELQAQTEELQAQAEELHAQSEELQAQSDEIHRQNEDLRTSREEGARRTRALEEVDRRKGEFLATLGHELRNPLAAVANAAHLIEAGAPTGALRHHAAIVTRQARQLRRLVDDLLDVSRINHGKLELRPEPLDARVAVEQAIEAARPAIDGKGHRLAVALPAEPLHVQADPARLQQVLANLIHNAAKYTPHGGAVEVAAERRGAEVVLRVRDSGIGIPPALLPDIWEPFTQGDGSAKQGLGLGLALVQRLVRLHGGRVEAHSDGPGRGSEFVVRLRADAAQPRAPAGVLLPAPVEERAPPPRLAGPALVVPAPVAPAAPLSPAASAPPRRAGKLRVLVVDDNEDLAETMGLMVEGFGHEVTVVNDAPSGLELCMAVPPDVALLDIGMPVMDGYQLATEIRRRVPEHRARLIAVTGYAQPEDRARAHEVGFDLHLTKPVDPEELRRVLERAAHELGAAPRHEHPRPAGRA